MQTQASEVGKDQRLLTNGRRIHQKPGETQTSRGKAWGILKLFYLYT